MSITELLASSHPLIQAPMAGSQGSALAIAVAHTGALGSVPAAMLDAQALRRELEAVRAAQPEGPLAVNVNFFCHVPPPADASAESRWREALAPYYREWGIDASSIAAGPGRRPFDEAAAEVLEAFKPQVVSFHFGLPAPALLQRVKAWGARVLSSATTVAEARWLEAHGADAIVAQGLEAGGHRGHFLGEPLDAQAGTFALLPQIVRAVRLPVIAAGGIADADGVAAAMRLGASAVQVGTAYLLAHEALTSKVHRAALEQAARGEGPPTTLTRLFSGGTARGLVNRLMRELGPMSELPPPFPTATPALAPLRSAAEAAGRADFSPLWSGQNPSGCRTAPAAEITQQLLRGFGRA